MNPNLTDFHIGFPIFLREKTCSPPAFEHECAPKAFEVEKGNAAARESA